MDEGKTIKELKENIDDLDKTNIKLDNNLQELNTDYQLKLFLRTNLTLIDLNKIRGLVYDYNSNKSKIELLLFSKAKALESTIDQRKLLLEEKRKLYSGLIPYIDKQHKYKYLEYIKSDAKIFNEQKEVNADIVFKKKILSNKVEKIENKILEHKEYINQSIKRVINTRLDEKIQNLNSNETFKILNIESKVKVLDKTISKIKIKLHNLKVGGSDSNSGTILNVGLSVLDKKIHTYNAAVLKLENFRQSLK